MFEIFEKINDFIWGVPLIVLILFTGAYLTLKVNFIQIRCLKKAFKYMIKNDDNDEGEVSSFGALCTALSATIGTGNIVGVATAISTGGPGALFWLIIASFLGMAVKYAEGFLSIKFRKVDKDNHVLGGPFYYIKYGMGEKWSWLAKIFAFFGAGAGLFGIGTITQINGITSAVKSFLDSENKFTFTFCGMNISWCTVIVGSIVTICAGSIIFGGLKRIACVSEFVVPIMAMFYISCTLLILILNFNHLWDCVLEILKGAFGVSALFGGTLGSVVIAMQKGIARGLFSTEAGLGSAPIASAAAKSNNAVKQGLISMTGTFDTMVICLMTGLAIVVCGSWDPKLGLEGVEITNHAFRRGLPFSNSISSAILTICLVFFAFTTIIGWNYYGERCVEFLSNEKKMYVNIYRWAYIFSIFTGPYIAVSTVWAIADIFNGLMAIPNVIAILSLSKIIAKESHISLKNKAKIK